jgi:hypothetical protein
MQLFIYSFALMIVENTPNKMTISRDTGSTISKGKQENQSILIQKKPWRSNINERNKQCDSQSKASKYRAKKTKQQNNLI